MCQVDEETELRDIFFVYVFRILLLKCIILIAHSLVSDGKIYDAYVLYPKNRESCLYSSDIFALKILPEVLERQCGYNLFIFGRNDLAGEGKPSEDKWYPNFLIGSWSELQI